MEMIARKVDTIVDLLEAGVEFESFEAFQTAMEQYEDKNFVQFTRIDSRSVEKAQECTPTKIYNPVIQFAQLTYACTFGPRKVASRSNGIRNSSSRKIDCPVRLRLSSTPDGQRLVIRESKLHGHNHEVSEEMYRSMARQKQLDEETEMEIYKLVSMHNDKRLARLLVRDRLTQEMGRSISVKEIINIEKKIFRRLERERMAETVTTVVVKGEQKETPAEQATEVTTKTEDDAAEDTTETGGTVEAQTAQTAQTELSQDVDTGDTGQQQEIREGEGEKEVTQPEHSTNTEAKVDEEMSDSEKATPEKKPKTEEQTTVIPPPPSSGSRPQRHRREPRRFREGKGGGTTKVLHTTQDNVVTILSPEQARQIGTEIVRVTPRAQALKVKETRGRKRKSEAGVKRVSASEHSEQEEEEEESDIGRDDYRRRKLAIQEELLEMEKKRMKVLDEIVDKLDLIIERQGKS